MKCIWSIGNLLPLSHPGRLDQVPADRVSAVSRGALGADNAEADLDGERQLGWYASGHKIALDVARGLSFLHGINVRLGPAFLGFDAP